MLNSHFLQATSSLSKLRRRKIACYLVSLVVGIKQLEEGIYYYDTAYRPALRTWSLTISFQVTNTDAGLPETNHGAHKVVHGMEQFLHATPRG